MAGPSSLILQSRLKRDSFLDGHYLAEVLWVDLLYLGNGAVTKAASTVKRIALAGMWRLKSLIEYQTFPGWSQHHFSCNLRYRISKSPVTGTRGLYGIGDIVDCVDFLFLNPPVKWPRCPKTLSTICRPCPGLFTGNYPSEIRSAPMEYNCKIP